MVLKCRKNLSRGEKALGVLASLCSYLHNMVWIWKNLKLYKIIPVNRSQTHREEQNRIAFCFCYLILCFKRHQLLKNEQSPVGF